MPDLFISQLMKGKNFFLLHLTFISGLSTLPLFLGVTSSERHLATPTETSNHVVALNCKDTKLNAIDVNPSVPFWSADLVSSFPLKFSKLWCGFFFSLLLKLTLLLGPLFFHSVFISSLLAWI